ncbi:MAG: SBBP repeat-containing protein, partial [Candidatus Kapaibacterium sp.]
SDHSGQAFVIKLAADGSEAVFSTYIGGSMRDAAYSMALDPANNIYLTGYTESYDFPVSQNAYQTAYKPSSGDSNSGDAFVSGLDSSGSRLIFSTYAGGHGFDRGSSINRDPIGLIYVAGSTQSSDFPTTFDAFQENYADTGDAFVFKMTNNGENISYSSYFGGEKDESGKSVIAFDDGSFILAGTTNSSSFTAELNPLYYIHGQLGESDIFVARLINNNLGIVDAGTDQTLCSIDSVQLDGSFEGGKGLVTLRWSPSEKVSDANILHPRAYIEETTIFTLTARDESNIVKSDQVVIRLSETVEKPHIGYRLADSIVYCVEDYAEYQWYYEDDIIAGATNKEIKLIGFGRYKVAVADSSGCENESEWTVINSIDETISAISVYPNPSGDVFTLEGNFGQTARIEIYTIYGELIYKNRIAGFGHEKLSIDLSGYSEGVYLMRIIMPIETISYKLIRI